MFQPGFGQRRLWRHSNVEVGGILIAGNCVLSIASFGFGLLLMGTFCTVISTAFESRLNDPDNPFRGQKNVPKFIGKILLTIGGIFFSVGLILLFIIIRNAKTKVTNFQGTPNAIISGTTLLVGPNYATTQPYFDPAPMVYSYPATGQTQPYPTQPQFQPCSSKVEQTYPTAPGQSPPPVAWHQPCSANVGQAYPPPQGQGQRYPQGPGQSPTPLAWQGQSYLPVISGQQPYPQGPGQFNSPPIAWQGQPYPQGPGQPYPLVAMHDQPCPSTVGGQTYPSEGDKPEKSTDLINLPYDPGRHYQTHPSSYAGNGHQASDAPPPYSSMKY